MGTEAGVSKLKGSMSGYESAGADSARRPGMVEADRGFELKAGLNGGSSGAALPISKSPGDSLMPESEGAPADDSDADEKEIVEPTKGFVAEPRAR